jgi:hypothetical protein
MQERKGKKDGYLKQRALVMEPSERQKYALLQQIRTIRCAPAAGERVAAVATEPPSAHAHQVPRHSRPRIEGLAGSVWVSVFGFAPQERQADQAEGEKHRAPRGDAEAQGEGARGQASPGAPASKDSSKNSLACETWTTNERPLWLNA